jgi:hypothetical protein
VNLVKGERSELSELQAICCKDHVTGNRFYATGSSVLQLTAMRFFTLKLISLQSKQREPTMQKPSIPKGTRDFSPHDGETQLYF